MTQPAPYKRREVIGDCTLYLGDCLEVMPTLGKVDAVVTDPPYGVGVAYSSFDDTQENVAALAKAWLPIARDAASRVCHTPGNINQHHYPAPTWTMAWITPAGTGSGPWGFSCWQPIMCYGQDPFLKSGKGRAPDILIHTEASEKNGHPCPKPDRFMRRLVARVSIDGETILDPFMGSGTTGVACVKLGRAFIGVELDEGYFDIACKRIEEAYRQPDMFVERPEPPEQISMEYDTK